MGSIDCVMFPLNFVCGVVAQYMHIDMYAGA